ncbi:MAG: hypothetical protein LBC27_01310, partial [Spirochaetaceae bacterium]|nr:hypothetical protein [Spirochaetaceae bacterium]
MEIKKYQEFSSYLGEAEALPITNLVKNSRFYMFQRRISALGLFSPAVGAPTAGENRAVRSNLAAKASTPVRRFQRRTAKQFTELFYSQWGLIPRRLRRLESATPTKN